MRTAFRCATLAAVWVCLAGPATGAPEKDEWTLDSGFVLERDTGGYHFPTALAFVPGGGRGPKDPLYFVVELRGTVKVVTNDRTVEVFDQGFLQTEFHDEPPDGTAEFGAAGICLDPEHGYVFVTYAYQDEDRLLRNDILRYETAPHTFARRPVKKTRFTELFRPFKSGVSHQIGPCQVRGDFLYVSVGDGFDTPQGSQRLDSLLGKILRLTLHGGPAPGNPFATAEEPRAPAGYVWAYGLRNPFGLEEVDGHLFVADNGLSTDRFLEIRKGENYLWDGTERSMAINVPAVISPSVGPVQMDHLPADSPLFPPEFRDRFYVALSGRVPGIMTFDYGVAAGKMRSAPRYFMQHRGPRQMVTGLAFGPDGLYFAPILPGPQGGSEVFRVRHDPGAAGAGTLLENPNPWVLLYEKGCYGCHRIGDVIRGGDTGPALDQAGLRERLSRQLGSQEYLEGLAAVDRLDSEPQRSFRQARQEVRQASGDDRLRAWVYYRVQEPRFDRILSAMPNCNVSAAEARTIADFLVGEKPPPPSLKTRIARFLPSPTTRLQLVAFAGGAFLSGILAAAAFLALVVRRRRRRAVP